MKYINEQNFNYMLLSIYIALDNVVAPDQEAKMKHIDQDFCNQFKTTRNLYPEGGYTISVKQVNKANK